MISLAKLAKLRKEDWGNVGNPECVGYAENLVPDLLDTIETLYRENAELFKVHDEFAEAAEHWATKCAKLQAVAKCLEMTRGQWIHSVNAKECLAVLAALGGSLEL